MKIGHFGGIKPGDILPVADIYESNCGEAPLPKICLHDRLMGLMLGDEITDFSITYGPLGSVSFSREEWNGMLLRSLDVDERASETNLLKENARLKARVRALEPEQPQPRPLYRWGRPV